ncbi:MAG: stealth conserved region 3 domain-containing protein [Rickettsiales bacterium]|nr:stealth conserved region 3 domain-containing protein [Rickettsiales bacterium]
MQQPIDMVILWVTDQDPAWRESFRRHPPRAPADQDHDELAGPRRFRDFNTLKYVLRSIERYAPWYNRLFLVTCGHTPDWLNLFHPRLVLKRHDEFFKNPAHLPVFNSNAIQVNLHHIPELAEQFVLFDDDDVLAAPTRPEEFFLRGLPVKPPYWSCAVTHAPYERHCIHNMRLVRKTLGTPLIHRRNIVKLLNYFDPRVCAYNLLAVARWLRAGKSGLIPGGFDHLPTPMLKSYNAQIEAWFGDYFAQTSSHRFREDEEASPFFINKVYYAKGHFHPGTAIHRTVNIYDHMRTPEAFAHYRHAHGASWLEYALPKLIVGSRMKGLNIQDQTTEALDEAGEKQVKAALETWLESLYPGKSGFEQ